MKYTLNYLMGTLLLILSGCNAVEKEVWQPAEGSTAERKKAEMIFPEFTCMFTVESMPAFPGGEQALGRFLAANLLFPQQAKRTRVQGKVFVSFAIQEDGSVTDIQVLKGLGFGCDEEAMRVISIMPKWKPGTQNGMSVKVKYSLPIKFGTK